MDRSTWKKDEMKVARFFDTVRTPLSGISSRHSGSDTLHKDLYIEIKMRKKIPFLKTFKETIEQAKEENKIPLVVFREKGSRIPIVMCNLNDLKKIGEYVI